MPPHRERNPVYVHSLTTEFASTLDEIPQDLSRHFADLRELDAVLSSALQSITQRLNTLTDRIEATVLGPHATHDPTALFRELTEIAEETGRIKLGGEDKIRVASYAADSLNAYYRHLEELVRQMHPIDEAFNLAVLAPKTQYPHVSPSALLAIGAENRRATRRTGQSNGVRNNAAESPVKPTQRRAVHLEDTDESTPRRPANALDGAYRPTGNRRPAAGTRRQPKDTTPLPSPAPSANAPLPANYRSGLPVSSGPSYLGSKPIVQSPLIHQSLPPLPSHKPTATPSGIPPRIPIDLPAVPSPGGLQLHQDTISAQHHYPQHNQTGSQPPPTTQPAQHPSIYNPYPSLPPPQQRLSVPPQTQQYPISTGNSSGGIEVVSSVMATKTTVSVTHPFDDRHRHNHPPSSNHHPYHAQQPVSSSGHHGLHIGSRRDDRHSPMQIDDDRQPERERHPEPGTNANVRDNDGDLDDDRLYCICGNVSFGEMVGCDGTDCETEWFHFQCVGLKERPEGEWLCDKCRTSHRRRGKGGRKKANGHNASGGRRGGKQ